MVKLQSIKGYELREELGAGGFGKVYKAFQSTVGRDVAVKIILPALANQSDFIRRFEGEAQVVARLEHPHITPLYDYWRDPKERIWLCAGCEGAAYRMRSNQGSLNSELLPCCLTKFQVRSL